MKTIVKFLSLLLVSSLFLMSCDKNDDDIDDEDENTLVGIQGEWYSTGTNVAPLLSTYFAVDSIYAKFNTDNTYIVESFNTSNVKTTYSGTYVQTKSTTANIYTIAINQSTPSVGASEGIFEVYTGQVGYDMKYEVVQSEPAIGNTAPTPTAGFGSSNGGSLGTINIQKYIRIKK